MANNPDSQGEAPRRPRLVLPGAADGPTRPKIVLPGLGVILDPNAQPTPEPTPEDGPAEAAEWIMESGAEVAPPGEATSGDFPGNEIPTVDSEATGLSADEFLSDATEVEPATEEAARPPELRAAPAELKDLAPRRLGPPPGWQPSEDVPPLEASPTPSQMVWDDPMPALEPEPEFVDPAGQDGPAGVPVVAPLRPVSSRVPTPLTSPHSDRPATRRVTQQVRTSTGQTTRHHATAGGTHAAPAHPASTLPGKHALLPPPQRLVPAWILVLIGLLIGAIGALVTVAKSPLRDKIGLVSRTDANAYVIAVLKEERSQVQSMLNEFHQNARVDLSDDMNEFRTEQGRKAPEKMTMDEFAAQIKEEAELRKQEEAEDKQIAEEEAKAKEEEEKEAAEPPAQP